MDQDGIEVKPRKREERVKAALVSMDEGDTLVHENDGTEEILAQLARWTLKPSFRRQSFNQLATDLEGRYAIGYSNPATGLKHIQENYVVPALARTELPREVFREELVNAQGELNVGLRKMDIAERSYRRLLRASRDPEVSEKDFSSLVRATIMAENAKEETLEKLGIPEQPDDTVRVEHTHRSKSSTDDFLGHITKERPRVIDIDPSTGREQDEEEGEELED